MALLTTRLLLTFTNFQFRMTKSFSFFLLILLISCSGSQQETTFLYKNEEASIVHFNHDKTELPLIVVLPDVSNSMLTNEVIMRLGKHNRVSVVHFLSHNNRIRQHQIDNLQNRTTFYSDQLTKLTSAEKDSIILLAEGLNANIASGMVHAQPINTYVLLNPYYPSLQTVLTSTCYAQTTPACDSLLQYLEFGTRYDVDSVFVSITNPGRDNQYGRYTTSYWKEILPLESNPQEALFKGKTKIVFTTNTGLAPATLPKNATSCSRTKLKETLATLMRN